MNEATQSSIRCPLGLRPYRDCQRRECMVKGACANVGASPNDLHPLPTPPRDDEAPSPQGLGSSEPVPEAPAPLPRVDAGDAQVAALNRIADALFANAEATREVAQATELLARATAGDFDQDLEEPPLRDLAGRPIT